jgi:hypothetical protein
LGAQDPWAVTTGLFLLSLNEMIDLHAKRLTAMENHVPENALILLYFLATMAVLFVGYAWGRGAAKIFRDHNVADPHCRGGSCDYRYRTTSPGLIKVGQQRMIELRQTLAEQDPGFRRSLK